MAKANPLPSHHQWILVSECQVDKLNANVHQIEDTTNTSIEIHDQEDAKTRQFSKEDKTAEKKVQCLIVGWCPGSCQLAYDAINSLLYGIRREPMLAVRVEKQPEKKKKKAKVKAMAGNAKTIASDNNFQAIAVVKAETVKVVDSQSTSSTSIPKKENGPKNDNCVNSMISKTRIIENDTSFQKYSSRKTEPVDRIVISHSTVTKKTLVANSGKTCQGRDCVESQPASTSWKKTTARGTNWEKSWQGEDFVELQPTSSSWQGTAARGAYCEKNWQRQDFVERRPASTSWEKTNAKDATFKKKEQREYFVEPQPASTSWKKTAAKEAYCEKNWQPEYFEPQPASTSWTKKGAKEAYCEKNWQPEYFVERQPSSTPWEKTNPKDATFKKNEQREDFVTKKTLVANRGKTYQGRDCVELQSTSTSWQGTAARGAYCEKNWQRQDFVETQPASTSWKKTAAKEAYCEKNWQPEYFVKPQPVSTSWKKTNAKDATFGKNGQGKDFVEPQPSSTFRKKITAKEANNEKNGQGESFVEFHSASTSSKKTGAKVVNCEKTRQGKNFVKSQSSSTATTKPTPQVANGEKTSQHRDFVAGQPSSTATKGKPPNMPNSGKTGLGEELYVAFKYSRPEPNRGKVNVRNTALRQRRPKKELASQNRYASECLKRDNELRPKRITRKMKMKKLITRTATKICTDKKKFLVIISPAPKFPNKSCKLKSLPLEGIEVRKFNRAAEIRQKLLKTKLKRIQIQKLKSTFRPCVPRPRLTCDHCLCGISTYRSLSNHLSNELGQCTSLLKPQRPVKKRVRKTEDLFLYSCYRCNLHFPDLRTYKNHVESRSCSYLCLDCYEEFGRFGDFLVHRGRKHRYQELTPQTYFYCNCCSQKLLSFDALMQHKRKCPPNVTVIGKPKKLNPNRRQERPCPHPRPRPGTRDDFYMSVSDFYDKLLRITKKKKVKRLTLCSCVTNTTTSES